MKTLLMGVAALSLIAAPAFAQEVDASATVTGTVSGACGVDGNMNGGSFTFDMQQYIGDDGRLANHDPLGFSTNVMFTAEQLFGDGEVWCNGPAVLTVVGAPLLHENTTARPAADDQFTGWLDLALRVNSSLGFGVGDHRFGGNDLNTGGGAMAVAANQRTVSLPIGEAFAGTLDGNLLFWGQEPKRFLAGTYTSTWTINIAPAN